MWPGEGENQHLIFFICEVIGGEGGGGVVPHARDRGV